MIQQVPLPEGDTLSIQLPSAVERLRDAYLQDVSEKLIVFLILALLFYVLARLARQVVSANIEDINRRHTIRKWIGYGYAILLVLTVVALFADALAGLGTIVAVVLAGVAIALQDILKSVVGWMYISTRSGVEVGSRIEVEGVIGDVIDIGVLKTTVLEVGNLVYGRQSTGRLVTIPNSRMLASSVFLSAAYNPFVWQEIQVVVTFESNWQRAEAILREIAGEMHEEIAPDLERGFKKLERRFAFKYGTITPIVYASIDDHGVALTLRFLTHVRRRRGSVDRITRRMLAAFADDPEVELAYPTYRVYRLGEEVPGRGGAAALYQPGDLLHPPPDAMHAHPEMLTDGEVVPPPPLDR
ncbi:MAG TPA: mechanosensitive ion channel family protein [Longimicrobiaceae bacterium]|nr:mechanosensitive ion channel family protein [Longimicrobiaceae bacterium]